jgi:hypothetical protein
MELFLIFGLIGTLELVILFGLIHYLMNRKNPKRQWWLVPICALIFGYGYAFNIFIIEKEGENSFSGFIVSDIVLYLFIFSFFSTLFCGAFAILETLLSSHSTSTKASSKKH